MKFVTFLLLSSLTILMVVAFPDRYTANANLPTLSHNVNSISAADNGGSSSSATQTDENIRETRGLLKKVFGYPERVVVVEKVYVPQNPVYSYPVYGNQYQGYGRRY